MAKKSNPCEKTVTPQPIESLIHVIRGQKVMVDADLADLYGVPTGALNQAVRRNMERFPEDFAFRLSKAEFEHWKSQICEIQIRDRIWTMLILRLTEMRFNENRGWPKSGI